MNLKTAAARLSVHYQTAYKLVRSGALTAVKIGGTYEISEAALERYEAERAALRSIAAAEPDRAAVPTITTFGRDAVLADVHAVAASTTTTAQGTFDTIVREAAHAVGDTCTVRLVDGSRFRPVAWYTTDPARRAALSAMIDAFQSDDPDGPLSEINATRRAVLVPHVPQDRMRASLQSEHRQFLDQIGLHSFVAAPAIVDGQIRAVVTMSRATPGAPYCQEDAEFAASLADLLALALVREDVYRAGWHRRRELVTALRGTTSGARTPAPFDGVLRDGTMAEVIDKLDGTSVVNDAAARLTHGDVSVLTQANGDTDARPDRFARGDLDFYDEERDMTLPTGEVRRFVVHRGLVRDNGAEPLALVVIAQPAPLAA
jgi:excisionase family DNA binding protein